MRGGCRELGGGVKGYGVRGLWGGEEKKVEDVGFPACHAVTPA